MRRALPMLAGALLVAATVRPAAGETPRRPEGSTDKVGGAPAGTAERITRSLDDPALAALIEEVLDRNPDLAALGAAARAAAQRPAQAGAPPDPMVALTTYLMSPETRVGPQRLMASLSERFPWFGKLGLREKAATLEAVAAAERVEAKRLALVTDTRKLAYELAFLVHYEDVVREDRATLGHYEELARARYRSGVGLEQAVVKIQAEMTRDDARLLDLGTRRAALQASLNALRDRPESAPLPSFALPRTAAVAPQPEDWLGAAAQHRPEVAEAQVNIERSQVLSRLAGKEYAPDVTLGLTYTLVGERTDPAGRAMPPPDDGRDVLGVTGGINIPLWRSKLAAGVAEAAENETRAGEQRRSVLAGIDRTVSELGARLPLVWDRLDLFQTVLGVQAQEALHSAEAAYGAGTIGSLDLLDAERVLLEVRIATERARADYAVAVAELEGAVARPVRGSSSQGD